jgi:hypothetical protein
MTKAAKLTPPYLPSKTLMNTVSNWRQIGLPNRIDRTLFRSFSGAIQTWLIGTLRYFALIDEHGTPTDRLQRLVKAERPEMQKILADMVRTGYPFVFVPGFDLSKATAGQIQDKFRATGLQGDTVRKAMALFMALAKEAGMPLSPFMKVPRQRSQNGPRKTPQKSPKPPKGQFTPAPEHTATIVQAKPFDVIYGMLDMELMSEEEQSAVWTLLRYLKKGGS